MDGPRAGNSSLAHFKASKLHGRGLGLELACSHGVGGMMGSDQQKRRECAEDQANRGLQLTLI